MGTLLPIDFSEDSDIYPIPNNYLSWIQIDLINYEVVNNITLVPPINIFNKYYVQIKQEDKYTTITKDNINSKQVIIQMLHWVRFCYQNKYLDMKFINTVCWYIKINYF